MVLPARGATVTPWPSTKNSTPVVTAAAALSPQNALAMSLRVFNELISSELHPVQFAPAPLPQLVRRSLYFDCIIEPEMAATPRNTTVEPAPTHVHFRPSHQPSVIGDSAGAFLACKSTAGAGEGEAAIRDGAGLGARLRGWSVRV